MDFVVSGGVLKANGFQQGRRAQTYQAKDFFSGSEVDQRRAGTKRREKLILALAEGELSLINVANS